MNGIYTVIGISGKNKEGRTLYRIRCNVCGYEKEDTYHSFHSSNMINKCRHTRFDGQYVDHTHKWCSQRLRKIYNAMILRYYCPLQKDYAWYGGKGISVCDEWRLHPKEFETWALEHGYEEDLTIDRICEQKDYEPCNCRWITLEENSRRAGKVNWIVVNGMKLTGKQWSEKLGIGTNCINRYIREYGIDKTSRLIEEMLAVDPRTVVKKSNESWFDTYGIN